MSHAALSEPPTTNVPIIRTNFGPAIVQVHGIAGPHDTRWKINRDEPRSFEEIAIEMQALGVLEALAPIPSEANGLVVTQASLHEQCVVEDVRFLGNFHADGCLVPRGKAMMLSAADCALLCAVSHEEDIVIAAHASRTSVLGKDILGGSLDSRTHFGVIDAIVEKMEDFGCSPEDISLGIFGGIRSNFQHLPNHPQYGPFNRSLIRFCSSISGALRDEQTGDIDMYAVIEGIARHKGIEQIYFDEIDTGSDENLANRNFASHRNPEPGAPPVRNLQIVYHRF